MNPIQAAQLAEQQRQLNIALVAQAARDKHTPAPQPLPMYLPPWPPRSNKAVVRSCHWQMPSGCAARNTTGKAR